MASVTPYSKFDVEEDCHKLRKAMKGLGEFSLYKYKKWGQNSTSDGESNNRQRFSFNKQLLKDRLR